ncbi:MAG: hypothetical protein H7A42_04375 [Chlamydiales bacterium]|nr:hypothetical protein [Chlamydiales bacterium]
MLTGGALILSGLGIATQPINGKIYEMVDRFHQSNRCPWFVWLAVILGFYTFILQGSPSVMIPQL